MGLFRGGEWVQTLLYWSASFGGLLLVHGVATWLPTLMRGEGYRLGSALTFAVVFNLGGIVGMLMGRLTVFIGLAALRGSASGAKDGAGQELAAAH